MPGTSIFFELWQPLDVSQENIVNLLLVEPGKNFTD